MLAVSSVTAAIQSASVSLLPVVVLSVVPSTPPVPPAK